MSELANDPSALSRVKNTALVVGIVCALVALIGVFSPGLQDQFMDSYLFAYLFVLGMGLGSLALVMLHRMTGGDWGYCIRRIAEASAVTMPLLTVLFIPIAMHTRQLFPWANPELFKGDKVLEFQANHWMTRDLWLIRACIYFAIWNILALTMWFGAGSYERTGNPAVVVRLQRTSALGLLLYVFSMTSAAVDWIMTREAHWYSSILGLVICVSQALSAIVLCLSVLRFASRNQPLKSYITPPRLNDLGNLFLALTVLWAYMSFAQLLVIWMGNTSGDSPFYIRRGFSGEPGAPHGWKAIAAILILLHFFIPFFILLCRINKRNIVPLSTLAMVVLAARALDVFWWAGPSSLLDHGQNVLYLTPRGIHWLDFALPAALFGIWLAVMLMILKARPLLARQEQGPELEHGALPHAHTAAGAQEMARAIELGHEPSVISVKGVGLFFIWFFGSGVVISGVIWVMYSQMLKYEESQNVVMSAIVPAERHPPEPMLQPTKHWHEANEHEDWQAMMDRNKLEFVQRGWMSEQGEFHIPSDVIAAVAAKESHQ